MLETSNVTSIEEIKETEMYEALDLDIPEELKEKKINSITSPVENNDIKILLETFFKVLENKTLQIEIKIKDN